MIATTQTFAQQPNTELLISGVGLAAAGKPLADKKASAHNRLQRLNEVLRARQNEAEVAVEQDLSEGLEDRHISDANDSVGQAFQMRCECLPERSLMDLVEHVLAMRFQNSQNTAPILIHVSDYQEAMDIDRRLSAVKLRTHLASPFSNWPQVMSKLAAGQIDVIISTTAQIPYADQVAWQAIYLPSALHLAMLTTPALDWISDFWNASNQQRQTPCLVVRR